MVSNTKPSQTIAPSIHTGDARRVGTSNPGRSKSAQKKKKKVSKGFSLLPIFFGMAVAFVIGAAILIYLIFTNSSNLLFSNRADVQVISFVGMTKDEFLATDYNNLLRAEFPEEYSSEPAGTIIRQTPKAGRTVKEKQRIVLTVSLGTQYVTIPETKNMVAEDAEQTLKDMGLRVTKKPMVRQLRGQRRCCLHPARRRGDRRRVTPRSSCTSAAPRSARTSQPVPEPDRSRPLRKPAMRSRG